MPDDIPAKPEGPFGIPAEGGNILPFDGRKARQPHAEDSLEPDEDLETDAGEDLESEPDVDEHTSRAPMGLPARIWNGPHRMMGVAVAMAAAIAVLVFVATTFSKPPIRPEVGTAQGQGAVPHDPMDLHSLQATWPRPNPPGWSGTVAPPDPYLQWERDNPRERPFRYRGLLDDGGTVFEPTPIPTGMTVDLKSVSPMGPSLLAWALEYLRLPRGTMEIRHAGSGFTLSLADFSLTPDGVLVQSSARAGRLVIPLAIMGLVMLLAHLFHGMLEDDPYARHPGRWHSLVVGLAGVGFILAGVLPILAVALLPLALAPPATFRRITLFLVASGLAYLCVTTPIEPPHPALAHLYGPLGRLSWDIVWLGGLAILCLLTTVRLPRQIITIRVAAPLIQDVRVVER